MPKTPFMTKTVFPILQSSIQFSCSAPTLSWDAMLNIRKVELKLISDTDMYLFFKKGMRGGVRTFSEDTVRPKLSI